MEKASSQQNLETDKQEKSSNFKSRKCIKSSQFKSSKLWPREGTISILMRGYLKGNITNPNMATFTQREGAISTLD